MLPPSGAILYFFVIREYIRKNIEKQPMTSDMENKLTSFVTERVHYYFWDKDINCAGTTILLLAEHFGVRIEQQVLNAAAGMHGAGGYRAQCGIVEGALMFIGIFGTDCGLPERDVAAFCKAFAQSFVAAFGSLSCSVLRPTGFRADDPPHLCEGLTVKAIINTIGFITRQKKKFINR